MPKGIFIVIDGIDGSGKATQTKLLADRFRREKRKVKTIDFPRYGENFFGSLIGKCLSGKCGDFLSIDPHIVSVLYACDRFESNKKIATWMKKGYVVIADRYVSANQIHQGAKISNAKIRSKFLLWLDALEHKVLGIAKPDMVVYLDVDPFVARKLLEHSDLSKKKQYLLKSENDVAEKNFEHQIRARSSALFLSRHFSSWIRVSCMRKDEILPVQEVSDRVWKAVRDRIIFKNRKRYDT